MMTEELTPGEKPGTPVQCAGLRNHYCLRIKDPATGEWVDEGQVKVSKWRGMTVSHGICPDCYAAYKRERDAAKRRKER